MFSKINISDIKGFRLGNAENRDGGTGCTVIISECGATAGVDVRGGSPATRETDLLRSENTVDKIHAVVLSGGSAYGLEASSGVMRELEDMNIGYPFGGVHVPVVCQASLFDLNVGDSKVRPDRSMGMRAVHNAYNGGTFQHGNFGAGTGASVGKYYGMNRAMKSGLGTFACSDGNIQVGAITAVNAFADVYDGNNNLIAGLLSADRKRIEGTIRPLKNNVSATSENAESFRLNQIFKRKTKIIEKGTSDSVSNAAPAPETVMECAPEATSEAVPESILEQNYLETQVVKPDDATSSWGQSMNPPMDRAESTESAEETFTETADTTEQEEEYSIDAAEPTEEAQIDESREDSSDGMGYDITFNTTISCLITNAKLTKAQCNKLATILHDGYARAIKPVHSTVDGDAIFVMTTGEKEVNFDAFAALATDIMQFSIIDGVVAAQSAYGLPAARDFLGK